MPWFWETYNVSPGSNNAAPPDGAPEGMAPSTVNNTMRQEMSSIREIGEAVLAPVAGAVDLANPIPSDAFVAQMYDLMHPVGKILTWGPSDTLGTTPNTGAPVGVVWAPCDGAGGTPNLVNTVITGGDPNGVVGGATNTGDAVAGVSGSIGATSTDGDHNHSLSGLTVDSATTGVTVNGTALTVAQLAAHTHTELKAGGVAGGFGAPGPAAAVVGNAAEVTGSTGSNATHTHGVTDAGHIHTASGGTIGNAGDHSHTTTGTITDGLVDKTALEFWIRTA